MRLKLEETSIRAALQEFDSHLRGSAEWASWQHNKAHRYAIVHKDRMYPVKKIASLATGIPVSKFSGGKDAGHANVQVKAAGFVVVPLHSANPDWVRDELILALDLYLKHRPNPPDKDSGEIRELSALLARLGRRLFPAHHLAETFRNDNGVYMKLMNFRRLDPQYTIGGKRGLSRGAKGEEEAWAEFANDPKRCREVAKAIASSADENLDAQVPSDPDEDFQEAPEGRLLTRKHLARERSKKLVDRKKRKVMGLKGKLECEACGFDFGLRYGERGHGFIECHHTKPVTTLVEGGKTHIDDLAILCANCHRIIHRRKPWLTIAQLREILAPLSAMEACE